MQVMKEWAYIHTFVRHCDSIGLAIPNAHLLFEKKYLTQDNLFGPGTGINDWPPPDMHSLLALAQHFRPPTRLLDWSTRSYVAAYFTISDALARIAKKNSTPPERLAVWTATTTTSASDGNTSPALGHRHLRLPRLSGCRLHMCA